MRKVNHRKIGFYLFFLAFLPFGFVLDANARQLVATETVCTGTDVSVSTTTETVVGTVTVQIPNRTTFTVRVRAFAVMTTSANSTTYKIRVRRTNISGTALGDAIAETIKVTAGGVEEWSFVFTDDRNGEFSALTYVSTIEMAGADGTTTVGENCLTADILS